MSEENVTDGTDGTNDEARKGAKAAGSYFESRPKDEVLRAFYAFVAGHYRTENLPVHNFPCGARASTCVWCGRTREQVRYDAFPPECQNRPREVDVDIAGVIQAEEEKANRLFVRARDFVPAFISKHGMTGETLAILHHTHGYDPETVDAFCSVPKKQMEDYHNQMEQERNRSRQGYTPVVIAAKLQPEENKEGASKGAKEEAEEVSHEGTKGRGGWDGWDKGDQCVRTSDFSCAPLTSEEGR